MCTVQWRHIAEMLSHLFKKEWLKRDSNQPLTDAVVMLGHWDTRKQVQLLSWHPVTYMTLDK